MRFVSLIDGLAPIEAARKIDSIYNLNLFPDKTPTAKERRRAAEAAAKRKREADTVAAFEEWEQAAFLTVRDYIWLLEGWRREYKPNPEDDTLHPLFAEALHGIPHWDYILDTVFLSRDDKIKSAFYKTHRNEVNRLEQKLFTIRESVAI